MDKTRKFPRNTSVGCGTTGVSSPRRGHISCGGDSRRSRGAVTDRASFIPVSEVLVVLTDRVSFIPVSEVLVVVVVNGGDAL